MKRLLFILLTAYSLQSMSQSLYYPPIANPDEWETLSHQESGIDESKLPQLQEFLTSTESKAFILLIDGKIALEYYFDDHSQTKPWYWASAGKTLTAGLVGIAQGEGYLDIHDQTNKYLGDWTECPDETITIWNQLTMTSGLDYTVANSDCTDPECLQCLNDPGTEWYYHNAPYTLLESVVANATGRAYNDYCDEAIERKIGMSGRWIKPEDNNVYWSTARDMARYGLCLLGEGRWESEQIIPSEYHQMMTSPSQEINESYGLLTWLNGQSSFRLPSSTITFDGSLFPAGPADAYFALGKNSQVIMVTPSSNMVLIRMGNDPDISPVPTAFMNNLWASVEQIFIKSSIDNNLENAIKLYPNPSHDLVYFTGIDHVIDVQVVALDGRAYKVTFDKTSIDISTLPEGVYSVILSTEGTRSIHRIVKI